jgi:HEAT repeat protein
MNISEIQTLLDSPDPEDQLFGLVYIGRLRIQTALSDVIRFLQHPDAEIRGTAAWALDLLGNVDALPALLAALYDTDYHVRSTAGWALLHLGTAIIPDVVKVLRDDENPDAREMAYQILSRAESVDAHNAIERYWKPSQHKS